MDTNNIPEVLPTTGERCNKFLTALIPVLKVRNLGRTDRVEYHSGIPHKISWDFIMAHLMLEHRKDPKVNRCLNTLRIYDDFDINALMTLMIRANIKISNLDKEGVMMRYQSLPSDEKLHATDIQLMRRFCDEVGHFLTGPGLHPCDDSDSSVNPSSDLI